MKALFLTRLYHPHIGGVEIHTQNVIQSLRKKGFHFAVVTSQHDSSLIETEVYQNIPIYRIPREHLTSKLRLWSWFNDHKDLFQDVDLIHAHDIFWWYLPFRFLDPTKPIFTTFHGWEGVFPPSINAKLLRRLATQLSSGTIQVGDYIKRWYGTYSSYTTYGGTTHKPSTSHSRQKLLVFGRLSHDNDLNIVIKALSIIKEELPTLGITFLGDGELAAQASSVGSVVGFQETTAPYLAKSAFVFSSSYLSILDSQASGSDVFSVFGNPLKEDYLNSSPFAKYLSISDSPEKLAASFLDHYYHPKKYEKKRLEAQRWALTQTWDKVADVYLKLWSTKYPPVALYLQQLDYANS